MAPPKWRGRLNTVVQCGTITGIVVGSAINIGAYHILWGWRLPLALAAVPGTILLLGMPMSFQLPRDLKSLSDGAPNLTLNLIDSES